MILSPDTKRKLAEAMVALEQDKPNKAAGHLREVADLLNEASAAELIAEQLPQGVPVQAIAQPKPDLYVQARNLESCKNGVHIYEPVDSNGWARCGACGFVNVAPPRDA